MNNANGTFYLDKRGTEEVRDCILCESDQSTSFDIRAFKALGLKEAYGVRRCLQCKLRWLSPRPDAESYSEIYSKEKYFGGEQSPEDYSVVVASRIEQFQDRVSQVERILNSKENIKFFEIGSATGDFLNIVERRGHIAEGVELSEDARAIAQKKYGLELKSCSLDQFEQGQFEVIHLNHVLEHLPNPLETLKACNKLLSENGVLVLEVPREFDSDLDHLKSILLMKRNRSFDAYSLHHTYFFDPANIRILLKKAGYDVISLRTSNPHRTPLRPFTIKNLLLRIFLFLSDKLRRGGNIIEVYCRKAV